MTVTVMNLPEMVSVALLVIGGQFGDGNERKQKLTKAGYDAVKVQKCVNELFPIINKYGG